MPLGAAALFVDGIDHARTQSSLRRNMASVTPSSTISSGANSVAMSHTDDDHRYYAERGERCPSRSASNPIDRRYNAVVLMSACPRMRDSRYTSPPLRM